MSRAIHIDTIHNYEQKLDECIKRLQSRVNSLFAAQENRKDHRLLSTASIYASNRTYMDTPFGYHVGLSIEDKFSVEFDEEHHRVDIDFSSNVKRAMEELECVKSAIWYFGIAMFRCAEKIPENIDLSAPIAVPARTAIRVKNSIGALLEENTDTIRDAVTNCALNDIAQTVFITSKVRMCSRASIILSKENDGTIEFDADVSVMGFRFTTRKYYDPARRSEPLFRDFLWELADSLWEDNLRSISSTLIDAAKRNGQLLQKEREGKAKEAKEEVDLCSAHADPSTTSEITAE